MLTGVRAAARARRRRRGRWRADRQGGSGNHGIYDVLPSGGVGIGWLFLHPSKLCRDGAPTTLRARDGRRKQMLFAALGASAAHIHGMTRSQRQCCLRSPQRRSAAVMSAALHLATIDDAEDFLLSSMCSHSLESVLTLDDAPKLAHSIAIDLDDALAGAMLPISEEGSAGITLCGRHGR